MKTFLVALLLALVVFVVIVESHNRGFKRGGSKRRRGPFGGWIKSMCKEERPKNCSVFNEDGKCIACDNGFALKEMKWSLACHDAICIPCKYMRFNSQCRNQTGARVCRRGCANCTESGLCTECLAGWKSFTISLFGRNLTKCSKCPWSGCQTKPKPRNRTCGNLCERCSEDGKCLECQESTKSVKLGSHLRCLPKLTLKGCGRYCEKCSKGKCLECKPSGRPLQLGAYLRCLPRMPRNNKGGMKSVLSSVTDGFRKMKSKMGERLRLFEKLG